MISILNAAILTLPFIIVFIILLHGMVIAAKSPNAFGMYIGTIIWVSISGLVAIGFIANFIKVVVS